MGKADRRIDASDRLHRPWMEEALALAAKGAGRTSPNPMVGCVIVKEGRLVGKGYHQRSGGPHAETGALKQAGAHAIGATMYVNLEPCSHFGKTPPCVHTIVEAGIETVVCAMSDPDRRVQGRGLRHLRENNVGVVTGVMQREAMQLNEAHIKFAVTGLPLVVMKIAQTLDGRIAAPDGRERGTSRFTGAEAHEFVHTLRGRYDAVLVGKNTALLDDPLLTVRAVKGRDPLRLVLDSWGKLPASLRLFTENDDRKTIRIGLAMSTPQRPHSPIDCFHWSVGATDRHRVDLTDLLATCGKQNVTSVLVEGGGEVFGAFVGQRLVDKIHVIVSPRFVGAGLNPLGHYRVAGFDHAVKLAETEVRFLGEDLLITGYPDWNEVDQGRDVENVEDRSSAGSGRTNSSRTNVRGLLDSLSEPNEEDAAVPDGGAGEN